MKEISTTLKDFSSIFETALLDEMESKTMQMQVKGGQTILDIGQPIQMLPLALNGTFKVSRLNEEGQEMLLYYIRSGQGCGMSFACSMLAHTSMIKGSAEEDSTLLCIPVNLMDDWMLKYSSWKKFVMSTIVNEFIGVIKSMDDLSSKKMDDRLVNYLKEKSKITGSSLVNLTHQQIADELGTNRVVVSRLLKKLEIDGKLLLYRNQIKLLRDL